MAIGGLLDEFHNIRTLEFINENFDMNMNFLKHHSLNIKFKDVLEFQSKPNTSEPLPKNNTIDVLLNIDKTDVVNLHKKARTTNEKKTCEICDR